MAATYFFRIVVSIPLVLAAWAQIATGQTWQVEKPVDVDLPTAASQSGDCPPVPPCDLATPAPDFFAPYGLWDRAWLSLTACVSGFGSSCGQMRTAGRGQLLQRGDGTAVVVIFWGADASSNYDCRCPPEPFSGTGTAAINATINLQINGPAGPVLVGYRWYAVSGNMFRPEGDGNDTPTSVTNTSVSLGALPPLVALGQLDLEDIKGIGFLSGTGTINANVGDVIPVTITADLNVNMYDPGRPWPRPPIPPPEWDSESVAWWGQITLVLVNPADPSPAAMADFSVDIGSASELSPPPTTPNRKFDPGDAYRVQGPVLPAFGANGVRDDARLFNGADPNPRPPATTTIPAPLCSNDAPGDVQGLFFDLDDFDAVDVDLRTLIPPVSPLAAPFPRFTSSCIDPLELLYISIDDDKPDHYTSAPTTGGEVCSIPTGSTSGSAFFPFYGNRTYGQTDAHDEVWLVVPGPIGPAFPVTWGALPIWSEGMVHPDLPPNPDASEATDDDVDGLDVRTASAGCPYFLFTVDHEARSPQLAADLGGTVYQRAPGEAAAALIDPQIHLGLLFGTDLRGLEFVFAAHPDLLGEYLALLFGVAPDDPSTFGADESGGLDPRMIYISYLDGQSQPLLDPADPLPDNVDAISNYPTPYVNPGPIPPQDNDDCADATLIATGDVVAGSTLTATADPEGPSPCGGLNVTAPGIWYSVVGNGNMLTASLCGQDEYDAQLFVYTGLCEALTCVAADDDGCQPAGSSRVSFCSAAGVTYHLLVTGWGTATGDYELVVTSQSQSPAETTLASVSTSGAQGNNVSYVPSISADGRYVAFASSATNLVTGDTNGEYDIFVRDRQSAVTTRVSVSSAGAQGNGASSVTSISADGRYVAFHSRATNLVPGDTNGTLDVFVHDRQTSATTRVSVSSAGAQGNGDSFSSFYSMSPAGRYVAFSSSASNLVPGDTNATSDVFVHDRQTATTTRVSVSSAGVEGNGSSGGPAISADGRYVAFSSSASNLVADDTNGRNDIFVHDRQTVTTTRGSVSSAGAEGNDASGRPMISADGRYITFYSWATNFVTGDTNGTYDIFVRDRLAAVTTRVNVSSAGVQSNGPSDYPSISADGRYVAFQSWATNLVTGDTNNAYDIFVRDRQSATTTRVSVSSAGSQSNFQGSSDYPSISADGQYVAFYSLASNLVPGDTNGTGDVFVRKPPVLLCIPPGDCDGDGDVQLDDWSSFAGCMTGPLGTAGPGCDCAKLDGDADVDLLDWAGFQVSFGP